MGHLLSRLINHLTQYSNSRNQLPSADERQQQQHQQESSADVGSSIEADRVDGEVMTSRGVELTSQVNEAEPAGQDKENTENHESQSVTIGQRQEDKNKPAVEEAAIKIQALFRGHLTRKALKDAQQQEINKALKQSQQNGVTDETVNCERDSPYCRVPQTLEVAPASVDILDHRQRSFGQPIEGQLQQDLTGPETTTAATPTTLISSFDGRQATTTTSLPPTPDINLSRQLVAGTNSHSIDSAEAAAIRIQSAFRGYHTRKHSPYRRRRSPAGNVDSPTLPNMPMAA